MQLDPTEGRVRCPSDFCQGGTHVERTCHHSRGCACSPLEKPCTLCGGTGFVLEGGSGGQDPSPSPRQAVGSKSRRRWRDMPQNVGPQGQ